MVLATRRRWMDVESATRLLLRNLDDASRHMEAAEPGTDDFLVAYERSCRLRDLYREVRQTAQVPEELFAIVD